MTWAFVTTTPGPAIQPDPSMPRPHALPVMRTTERLAAWTSGSLDDRRIGRAHVGLGALDRARGVDPAKRVQESARRRGDVVQRDEDGRALHRFADLARVLARQVEGNGSEDPGGEERQPEEEERAA